MLQNISRDGRIFIEKEGLSERHSNTVAWAILILFNPGFQFVSLLRFQGAISRTPILGKIFRRIIWFVTTTIFRSDVDPAAKIGPGLYCPHPFGIVIGGGAVIGEDVSIREGVTLGRPSQASPRDPIIGNRVAIGPRAAVLGGVTIGDDCVVEAGSIVLKSVAPNSHLIGNPPLITALV